MKICRKWQITLCLRHWWLRIDYCKDTKYMYNFIHTSKDRSWMHIWLILRSVTLQFTYTCHQHPNGFVLGEDPRPTWVTAASREYFSAVIRTGNLGAVKQKGYIIYILPWTKANHLPEHSAQNDHPFRISYPLPPTLYLPLSLAQTSRVTEFQRHRAPFNLFFQWHKTPSKVSSAQETIIIARLWLKSYELVL